MFLKSVRRVRPTMGVRLTVWYSSLFILSTLALFGTAYMLLSSAMQRTDRAAIRSKLDEYATKYTLGGLGALDRTLAVETSRTPHTFFIVRVAGPSNNTILLHVPRHWSNFNTEQLTRSGLSGKQWMYVPTKDDDEDDDQGNGLAIASLRLFDHTLLQVGTSTEGRDELLERFWNIFAGVMIPVVVLGFAGGSFLAFRAVRPVRHLLNSLQSIMATGNLTARVPLADTHDQLDELGILFNGLLDKIAALFNGMQSSLDNVAHDLRTPMTRLRGIAEVALQSEEEGDLLREALVNCIEESEQILAMVNTLMDISEAETGTMQLALDTVNVSELIDQVVELYCHVAEDKQIGISATAPRELSLTADRNRMLQVLANLLDNAIKYTPNGGRVDIVACSRGREVVITVTDTGIGIPPEERSKIWDRLFRGDKSRSQRGLGLGLSLVKAIAQAHQGCVEVSTDTAYGSQFVLHLPAKISA